MRTASLALLGLGPHATWVQDRPSAAVSSAAVLWRMQGTLHVSVILKATFVLVQDGAARLIAAEKIAVDERPLDGVAGRSVEVASDLAPHKGKCDVTFMGHAYPPGGEPAPAVAVRMAVVRGDKPLLDKTLRVYGDRTAGAPTPAPFGAMLISYERAYGGPTFPANPVGIGADARVRTLSGVPVAPSNTALPNIVDPKDPTKPGGFGPISEQWPSRRRILGTLDPSAIDAPIATIPSAQIFSYFQTAPQDQQIEYLRGDEWIVLDNVNPTLPRVASRLPGIQGACRLYMPEGAGYGAGRPIALRTDTLIIDGDAQTCSLLFRGNFPVLGGEQALSALRIACAVEVPGHPVPWPSPQDLTPRAPQAAPAQPAPSPDVGATAALTEEDLNRLAADRATPFSRPGQPAEAPPSVPVPAPPKVPVSHAPIQPPVAKPKALESTTALTDSEQAAMREDRDGEKALPFVRGEASPDVSAPSGRPSVPRTGPLTGTTALTEEDQAAFARIDPLPFVLPAAPSAPAAPQKILEKKVPRRIAAAIPIASDSKFAAATVAWQVRPPKDSITVVVKGTFDLVENGPATWAEEPDPLLGDVYAEDDPEKALLYPTDLAIFKPRCDVTLGGRAHAPKGRAPHMQVGFRVGEGPKKVERSANVIGNRTWKKAMGIALAPTDPEPFETMPLTHARAYGGPEHAANPVGVGHKSAALPDGTWPLPNLEDPNKPIRNPSDTPLPQCFAPISPGWKLRAKRLGTYDKKWFSTRWPYFPEDLDWEFAQHAPPQQQGTEIAENAPYEVRGMLPNGATIRGELPGIKARCFAERTTEDGEGGGGFHEIPLKLDTVHFDMDAKRLILVWRGLLEVSEEDAPEVACLFLTEEPCSGPALSPEQAREKMLVVASRTAEPAESPEPGEGPANDVAAPEKAPSKKSPETASFEAEMADKARARQEQLKSAGVGGAKPDKAPPKLPPQEIAALPPDPRLREAAIAALEAGALFDGADLSDADLSDLDFEGRSLRGAILLRANLRGAHFENANLQGAQLAGADLTDAHFEGATAEGADFAGAILEGASFEGAFLEGALFSRAKGRKAIFRRALGGHAMFTDTDLPDAVFDEASLPAVDFSNATLDEASFVRAQIPEVRLLETRAKKARFDGAKMPKARAAESAFAGCSFRSVEAPNSVWDNATLTNTAFVGATLTSAGFSATKAEGADFGGVDAVEARFRKADLRNARFLGANLMKATFEKADLTNADLRGANLHEAETWKARVKGAQTDLAIATKSKLAKKG